MKNEISVQRDQEIKRSNPDPDGIYQIMYLLKRCHVPRLLICSGKNYEKEAARVKRDFIFIMSLRLEVIEWLGETSKIKIEEGLKEKVCAGAFAKINENDFCQIVSIDEKSALPVTGYCSGSSVSKRTEGDRDNGSLIFVAKVEVLERSQEN